MNGPRAKRPPEPVLKEISYGVYAYIQPDGSWGLNNTGFLVGSSGVLVIDTCFTEQRTRAFLAAIEGVTDVPLRTLANTHHHGDHTHGNFLLPSATIIGHRLCREAMLSTGHVGQELFPGVTWGHLEVVPPFVTFEDRLTLHVDDLEVEAIYVGPAHTTNDVVYWVPAREVLFAGDLAFNGGTPFVAMGSLDGSLRAVEELRALEATTIVPGHGPVCGSEIWDDMVAYLEYVRHKGDRAFEAGLQPLEAARQLDLGRFATWHNAERIVGNLHRRFSERRGEEMAAPLDAKLIWREMAAYSGRESITSVA